MATNFSKKTEILAELHSEYEKEDHFREWAEYHDIGLPLSNLIAMNLCQATEDGEQEINETWTSLLDLLCIEDTGFEYLSDIFDAGEVIIID
jgi:hypothetical protein